MEIVLRVTLIYIFVFFALRVLGKREFGQLTPFELVTLMLIPEMVQQALMREDFSMTNAFVALSTLFVLVYLTSTLAHLHRGMERVLEGTPAVLVSHGRLLQKALNRERVTTGEIYNEMHKVGLEDLHEVKWAILETDGRISIVPLERTGRQRDPGDGTSLA